MQKENEYHNVSKFILSIPFKEDKETEIKPEKDNKTNEKSKNIDKNTTVPDLPRQIKTIPTKKD